jgi:hypothetical protein
MLHFLYEGEVKAEIHKTLLPTYDVFDEYRYFEPAYNWQTVLFKGKKLVLPFVKIFGTWEITRCIEFAQWTN